MLPALLLLALASSPLAAAHGKVSVIQGDAGGNGTALAIRGAVVPGPGPNSKTEVDTTVFGSTEIKTDGLGRTNGSGKNKLSMLKLAMAQSGATLPQVSAENGTLEGVFHIVTTDGAGPVRAVIDTTGTGKFSQGTVLDTLVQVPGKGGNIRPTQGRNGDGKRGLLVRAAEAVGLVKRGAVNVNEDYPMKFAVPAGTTCTGTVNGVENVCLVKIANSNKAGPFGGVVAVQIAGSGQPAAGTGASVRRAVAVEFEA
ncbi:Cell surface protein [Coniochaeta hoffmannii]|uniref:Cell surface protein n=1 Tax=Coniochaeta hoffmannii TaxID=91930 RepID=A0AA38VCP1_9PEZI|nr:Cell surface protein [Coniochaeta hoffmannii]